MRVSRATSALLLLASLLVLCAAPARSQAPQQELQRCGTNYGSCAAGECCSSEGWCGVGEGYCGAGCRLSFGTCNFNLTIRTSINTCVEISDDNQPVGARLQLNRCTQGPSQTFRVQAQPDSSFRLVSTLGLCVAADVSVWGSTIPGAGLTLDQCKGSYNQIFSFYGVQNGYFFGLALRDGSSLCFETAGLELRMMPCSMAVTQRFNTISGLISQPPSSVPAPQRCGPGFGGSRCSSGQCCSASGWCGVGSLFCDLGCQEGSGWCDADVLLRAASGRCLTANSDWELEEQACRTNSTGQLTQVVRLQLQSKLNGGLYRVLSPYLGWCLAAPYVGEDAFFYPCGTSYDQLFAMPAALAGRFSLSPSQVSPALCLDTTSGSVQLRLCNSSTVGQAFSRAVPASPDAPPPPSNVYSAEAPVYTLTANNGCWAPSGYDIGGGQNVLQQLCSGAPNQRFTIAYVDNSNSGLVTISTGNNLCMGPAGGGGVNTLMVLTECTRGLASQQFRMQVSAQDASFQLSTSYDASLCVEVWSSSGLFGIPLLLNQCSQAQGQRFALQR